MKNEAFVNITRQPIVSGCVTATCAVLLLLFTTRVQAAERQVLHGHVPAVVARLQPLGNFAGTNRLNLAIGLPLRNQAALSNLLHQIYDPASANYHHFLTPEQFTEQFGPTEKDYEAVIAFAKAHGLSITATHPNRMLVDVNGSVADIEQAMHVKMRVYQHPTEKRMFHAPDTEPSLDLATPILRISGLDDYSLPKPRFVATPLVNGQNASPNSGSGPSGTFMGNDFRAAYAPDTWLAGAGQIVGLLQFDGYTASDITYYESQAGLPSVTLSNVLIDGASGGPSGSGGEVEVSLDIEDAISMAPGLSEVMVYMEPNNGSPWEDILNRMADDNLANQLSCSWYSPDTAANPVADQIFQQMGVQGQSFFCASGDGGAYTSLIPFPEDTPYITEVGGTTLTTSGPGGAWVSESAWTGSGGGISTQYPIPTWQANVNMTASRGSTAMRNVPDVALTAQNVYVRCNGKDWNVGGTSCAAPLWAGFIALVNQQAAASGQPAVGFINPVVYAIGCGVNSVNYTSAFHDITTGNNHGYSAVPGYDLCTGWGTPAGQNLIDAMLNPEPLLITPPTGFSSGGRMGGPFTITSQNLSLTNAGTDLVPMPWTLVNTSLWLNASPSSGALMPGDPATIVTVSLNPAASNLALGTYNATVWFTNINDGIGQSRQFTLAIGVPPVITTDITTEPTNHTLMAGGLVTFSAGVTGTLPMYFQCQKNGASLAYGKTKGSMDVVIGPVTTNDDGNYTFIITNLYGSVTSSVVKLTVLSPIVSQPQSLIATNGSPASFTVSVFDLLPLSFQWQKNRANLTDGGNISGSLTTNLLLHSTAGNDVGDYTVIITSPNVYGSVTSSVASLAVGFPPVINTTEPTNQTVLAGNTATFSAAVSGTGPFTYQWQLNGANLPNDIITTAAGNGIPVYSGDGGAATNASVNEPSGVAVDAVGNLFIADSFNNLIRKVDLNGIITTVAGNSSNSRYGYSGDGGPAINASLNEPFGVAVDASGNLFIADSGNNVIRKVDPNGIITTVAGNYSTGESHGGDGGAATNASLYNPCGVVVDAGGNLFIADTFNGRIRKVDTNGIITTVAGNGTNGYTGDGGAATNASLYNPDGVAVDASGNLFIADSANGRIRKVDTNGIITTVPTMLSSALLRPSGVAVDTAGNLFIADWGNARICKVDADNIFTTVAGNGTQGYSGDGGVATNANLCYPYGVAVDATGNLFIADTDNSRIRKIMLFASYPTIALGDVTPNNTGNYTIIITSPYGSVTSSIVTLTVVEPIVSQPQSLVVTNGSPASFSVSVFNTLPLSFQWQKNGVNLTDGGILSGSLTTNLLLQSTTTNDDGNYTIVVTCLYGSVTSSVASLAVGFPPVITAEPTNQTFLAGGMATFNVAVSGTGPFTYQWQLNGTNLPNGIITTVAGDDIIGYSGDGGAATNASLNYPMGATVDTSGNLFVADLGNNVIRKVDTNGIITTVAGNGSAGFSGDGGPATNANLFWPSGVAVDASGNLFIADTYNELIRKVDTNGIITTVAGNGYDCECYSGDGVPATDASLYWPWSVAVDATGNLLIADTYNNRIRKVDTNGIITTVAGKSGIGTYSGDGGAATNASLNLPSSTARDASGNLIIADMRNNLIRKVDPNGIITTVAGGALLEPGGVAMDAYGNLFIADSFNNRIRKVDPNGIISTAAGTGAVGYSGDGGAATNALMDFPNDVAVDASGNLFIAATDNNRIREVFLFASYPILTLGNVTLNNAGNYTVIITSPYGSVTSSIVTLTVAASPIISKIICHTDGNVTFNLLTAPNTSSRILVTTNLTPPVVWQPIYTNVPGADGAWQFTDLNASNYPARFYRSSTP